MNIVPKKSLGQNFLNNQEIVKRIIKDAKVSESDIVLEVGPGEGVLTEELAKKAKKVLAIEIDRELISFLAKKFENTNNLKVFEGDVLKVNLKELFQNENISGYKLIANIPYYITSKIIRLFLETELQPKEIILMVQKEVAERIIAPPGKMSKLSVSVQYFAEAEMLFDVPRENFNPAPEVDSVIIRIFNIKRRGSEDDKQFFKIVRSGFCARRKTLVNNLANSLHLPKKEVGDMLKSLNISLNTRAQELSVDDWKILVGELQERKMLK